MGSYDHTDKTRKDLVREIKRMSSEVLVVQFHCKLAAQLVSQVCFRDKKNDFSFRWFKSFRVCDVLLSWQ